MFLFPLGLEQYSHFERFRLHPVQMVKNLSFKKKLLAIIPRRAEVTQCPLMANFPRFYTADFLLQITALLILGREADTLMASFINIILPYWISHIYGFLI